MEHLLFKHNHTAAAYVVDGLDPTIQQAFELHMMSCTECTGDVEIWRAAIATLDVLSAGRGRISITVTESANEPWSPSTPACADSR